ncbi:hypothetical protein NP493_1617g00002 [Ridgeia piscesae]|uniref:Uncharacterized protein n=1 Tax=Ridgeia piscesae TaxID=27915 RepID=A0AAD9N8N3_RIDPI|nr:hypothetical protein NP493_1617g00002 [Ridgeia piscesae]
MTPIRHVITVHECVVNAAVFTDRDDVGADVFIPEPLEGSKEEKEAHDLWVERKLIPALDGQCISYLLPSSRDFPITAIPISILIDEAVKNCTYTLCTRSIISGFYRRIFDQAKYQDKLIFIDLNRESDLNRDWPEFNSRNKLDFSGDNKIKQSVRKIRKHLDERRKPNPAFVPPTLIHGKRRPRRVPSSPSTGSDTGRQVH